MPCWWLVAKEGIGHVTGVVSRRFSSKEEACPLLGPFMSFWALSVGPPC